jgi:hypothetical protein
MPRSFCAGDTFDMGDLATSIQTSPFDGRTDFTLAYKFCGIADPVRGCATDKSAFCMLDEGTDYVHGSRWQSADDILSATTLPDGVTFSFQNTHDFILKDIFTEVTLTCASTAGKPVIRQLHSTGSYKITFALSHPAGCPITAGGGGGGLSGGSIFLIIFFVSAFVYVAVGCALNWKLRGLTLGKEACPQRAFWAAVASNCVAGVQFTKGGCKKTSGYSTSESEGASAL